MGLRGPLSGHWGWTPSDWRPDGPASGGGAASQPETPDLPIGVLEAGGRLVWGVTPQPGPRNRFLCVGVGAKEYSSQAGEYQTCGPFWADI